MFVPSPPGCLKRSGCAGTVALVTGQAIAALRFPLDPSPVQGGSSDYTPGIGFKGCGYRSGMVTSFSSNQPIIRTSLR